MLFREMSKTAKQMSKSDTKKAKDQTKSGQTAVSSGMSSFIRPGTSLSAPKEKKQQHLCV
jgi:hypothetical protein